MDACPVLTTDRRSSCGDFEGEWICDSCSVFDDRQVKVPEYELNLSIYIYSKQVIFILFYYPLSNPMQMARNAGN